MMSITKFEKFEMKYGYFLPSDYKDFINLHGGDFQYGSCNFDYPSNIINNLIRIPGYMDFHLVPFGDIGNGDNYCFYRYGTKINDYYIGLWLHETCNFVILCSTFRSFLYKCLLDEYLSTIVNSEDMEEELDDEEEINNSEAIQRCIDISEEFNFDFEKVKLMKNEYDYHKLMIEFDECAIQSLCYIGKQLLNEGNIKGLDIINLVIKQFPFYTAPYFIAGKGLLKNEKDGSSYFINGLKTSLITTGYSYWEEDYIEIPEDVHREIELYCDGYLVDSSEYFYKKLYSGIDTYDFKFRYEVALKYYFAGKYEYSIMELNNALFCADNLEDKKETLLKALEVSKKAGYYYLVGIIEHDLKNIK